MGQGGGRREEGGGCTALLPLPSSLLPPPWLLIALLALLASGASLVNGFVYDDTPIIEQNARVHTLARWWEMFAQAYWPAERGNLHYRPVTVLSFAVQWLLGDGSATVFHAVNVVLYVATCAAVLALARLLLPASAAWIVAALFAVHPVHVEVVANVVGQSELIVALCSALAVAAYIRMRAGAGRRARSVAAIALLYAVACLAKEPGFLLPALLLAAELTIVGARLAPERRAIGTRARAVWATYAVCAAVSVSYLLARHAALGRFDDEPNVMVWRLTGLEMLLTMLAVVPEWARLLLWPARLAADYSPPQTPLLDAATPAVWSGIVILAGAVVVAAAAWRRGRRLPAFGLLWFAVAILPVSNILVRSGVLLSERSLFVPSIGAMIALGAGWTWIAARLTALRPRVSRIATASALATLAIVLSLGVAKSTSRSRVWRDSDTFFAQIIEDAPLSYRAHQAHGTWLFLKQRRAEGERHLQTAIAMFPHDPGPIADLADLYRLGGMCAPARELYRRVIALRTIMVDRARLGLIVCLLREEDYAAAAAEARVGPLEGAFNAANFRRFLATADSGLAASATVRQTGAPRRPNVGGTRP